MICSYCFDPIDQPPVNNPDDTTVFKHPDGRVRHGDCQRRKRDRAFTVEEFRNVNEWKPE